MAKYIGNATLVKLSTDNTTTSSTAAGTVTVGNVMNFSGPETDAPDVDTTVLATTGYGTQAKGIPMPGSGTMNIAYEQSNAGVNKLIQLAANRTVAKFWICYASTALSDHGVKAYVKGLGREIERDAMIMRSVSLGFSTGPGWNT